MKNNQTKPRGFDPGRRAVLAKLGRFAAYTAPTLTTLLIVPDIQAAHKPGHIVGGLDLCAEPNPPAACGNLPPGPCENAPNNPLCQVASLGGGDPESAGFSGEDFDSASEPAGDDDPGY